jgi:hypothetical protein
VRIPITLTLIKQTNNENVDEKNVYCVLNGVSSLILIGFLIKNFPTFRKESFYLGFESAIIHRKLHFLKPTFLIC